jgi:hypothetical protein
MPEFQFSLPPNHQFRLPEFIQDGIQRRGLFENDEIDVYLEVWDDGTVYNANGERVSLPPEEAIIAECAHKVAARRLVDRIVEQKRLQQEHYVGRTDG